MSRWFSLKYIVINIKIMKTITIGKVIVALIIASLTAISDQTNHKKICKSVAKQHSYKFSWFRFERKALYVSNIVILQQKS